MMLGEVFSREASACAVAKSQVQGVSAFGVPERRECMKPQAVPANP